MSLGSRVTSEIALWLLVLGLVDVGTISKRNLLRKSAMTVLLVIIPNPIVKVYF